MSSRSSVHSLVSSKLAAINSIDPGSDVIDLLSWKMSRAYRSNRPDVDKHRTLGTWDYPDDEISSSFCIDSAGMTSLLFDDCQDDEAGKRQFDAANDRIQHAPLIDAKIVSDGYGPPQYGLLGSHTEAEESNSKLYLNTNVPFSMFICGVQGSGKSHTTSCILENALIPSRHLGKLQNPLSALVFSYAQFSGDGFGFTISEAAFLASSDQRLPGGAHVKRVHVLVSPSNFVRISKLYRQLPNVLVTPFKLMPQDLDIDTILTLMNVSESIETPLYMAQVTQILREMSTAGEPFNYKLFKLQLKKKEFNSAQASMLQLRLDLLESFLELNASCVEPHFQFGEVTIMDMSCPFVDANTACILFRIGLKLYLQSKGNGKMIVLDEAHKYMVNVPGAKSLNETLLQTIRLQRHYGARVVISTQEPTLLTDLIALCSITVIHRFSSPEWLSAIRRHIPTATEDRESLMRRIESLTTGMAMIYSPNAVYGRHESGELITGTSKLINISIRRRITCDGGQSVLAV
ncbi:uncharacterized protein CC84DRAFT_1086658 [Paraphaeosphaeria sporulosa]|uniref:AAA+ ATPase domain-containing protein n=1 Tax=Paraphaeosphaeria sporulosa TaxID=1460663 RepID=A0A177CMZ0_9PLEO|nr:uncharacterized protein CC84DRAFT_1086658 [Paraphaeosphaeria sporulosa]OAG08656.1 hypothetical protein CC84DRAFT_1086658 [Paraphaeosphaeria sporulosa]